MSGAPGAGAPGYIPYTDPLYAQTVKPLIIGSLLSFTFFGIGLVQFYLCFSKLRLESMQDKITFYFLAFLFFADFGDTLGKGLFIGDQLHNVIVGGLMGSAILPKSTFALIPTETLITCLNHAVYVYRIWRLTPNRGIFTYTILALAISVSIVHVVGAVYTCLWIPKPVITWVETGMVPYAAMWTGGAAAADALLCILFVGCLARHRSDFSSTNDIITQWIGLSLETGLLPSALQILCLALVLAFPHTVYQISVALFQPKIYVNSILIIINTVISNRHNGPRAMSTAHNTGTGSNSFQRSMPHTDFGAKRPPYGQGVQMNSMGGRPGNNLASQVVVTSEVYRHGQDHHVELNDQQSDYEKSGTLEAGVPRYSPHSGHVYSGNYGR